jgi:hypothetical protein
MIGAQDRLCASVRYAANIAWFSINVGPSGPMIGLKNASISNPLETNCAGIYVTLARPLSAQSSTPQDAPSKSGGSAICFGTSPLLLQITAQ